MTISTQNLHLLPGVSDLRKLLQSLATLDLIMSPDWEYRYYSFNSNWGEKEHFGSMRNGFGDTFFALFTASGCFFKGFAHEYPMSSWKRSGGTIWPGLLDGVPTVFDGALAEPAFSMEDISFCFWRLKTDPKWRHGPVEFHSSKDPDGSEFLLGCLDGNPGTYQDFAEEYYEEDIPLAPIRHIYNHQPITGEVLEMLNPGVRVKDIRKELGEIGYPASSISVSWIVSTSALAACSLLIAVVASWRLTIVFHPELPIAVESTVVKVLWNGMLMGYGLGFLSLLVSIGLSGWLRSRKCGLITSYIAFAAVLFFVIATPFGV